MQELATWPTEALERLLTDPVSLPAGPLVVRSRCYGHLLTPNVVTGASGQAGYGYESSGVTALPAILDHTPLTAPGTWTTPPDRAAW